MTSNGSAPTACVPSTMNRAPAARARVPTASRSNRRPSVQCSGGSTTAAVRPSTASISAAFHASPREPAVSGAATVRSVAPVSRHARRQAWTALGNCSSTTTTVCPAASGVFRTIVAIA